MEIRTIENEVTNTLVIEKSKFIGYLMPCNNRKEAEEKLNELRNKHQDATHVCYAYIIIDENVNLYKSSDDGEPSQTAGAPILNVLKKNGLTNVLCAVIRYFGGIKLGAGGLTRAYTNSASNVLSEANIVTLVDAYTYKMVFAYNLIKDIEKILESNNLKIVGKDFAMEVCYKIVVFDKQIIEVLKEKLSYLNVKFIEDLQILAKKN